MLEREHHGAADITDIVIVANQLSHLDIDDTEACRALMQIPSCRRLGIGPDDLHKLLQESAEEIGSLAAALG